MQTANPSLATWMPWSDRAGRLVPLKLVCVLGLCAPAVWMGLEYWLGWVSANPIADLVKESGDWSIRALVVSLAVTPLRYVVRWNRLVLVRRMFGLAALYYTLLHILLWIMDLRFDWANIASELFLRSFLTVGLVGTLIMVALGVTSNDWSIQHMGAGRWNALHAWVYAAVGFSLLHYFMEVRLDATEVTLMSGYFLLLMAFRFVRKRATPGFLNLSIVAVGSAIATALAEATYYKLSTGVNVMRVLYANLDFSYSVRPAWWVLGTGIAVAILADLRARFAAPTGRRALHPQDKKLKTSPR